jgi:hypothetical protein
MRRQVCLGASRGHFWLLGCFIGKLIAARKFMSPTIDIMGADQFWATYLLHARNGLKESAEQKLLRLKARKAIIKFVGS